MQLKGVAGVDSFGVQLLKRCLPKSYNRTVFEGPWRLCHKCLDTLWIGLGLGVIERGREGMEAETSVMSLGPGPALGEALP